MLIVYFDLAVLSYSFSIGVCWEVSSAKTWECRESRRLGQCLQVVSGNLYSILQKIEIYYYESKVRKHES